MMLKKFLQRLSAEPSKYFLILVGSLSWSLTMIKSGIQYTYGTGFWGPNAHDGVWHIALAQSLAKGTWEIPIFAGELIKNYHIGFDLILSILHKITFLPISTLYFQIFPPLLAVSVGLLVYDFVLRFRNSKTEALWATFFVYFGGSFGWVINLFRHGTIDGESLFWSQQSVSTLVNPPFALSLVFIFAGLSVLHKGIQNNDQKLLLLATFLFGVLVQIKVYGGILVLSGLFAASLLMVMKDRDFRLFKVAIGNLILSILFFSSLQNSATESLVFRPFWFLEEMMSTRDRLFWPRYAEAMFNYRLGNVFLKGTVAYLFALLVFILGNFGIRIISSLLLFRRQGDFLKSTYLGIFFLTLIFAGVLLPTFYVQTGTPWNTIQFMYYSLIFSGILTGVYTGSILEKNASDHPKIFIVIFVILLTLPTTVGTLIYHYLPYRSPARISWEEVSALNFLSGVKDGVVLTQPFDKKIIGKINSGPPLPIHLYETTGYVSAYTGKKTFLEDEVNLEITGYSWEERKNDSLRFFSDTSYAGHEDFVRNNNISYIYIVKELQNLYGELRFAGERIFENSEILIYEIRKI